MSATVSVITPIHNNGETIARAIESLQAEQGVDWEQIVVDDGSTDDGPAVVSAIAQRDPRIRLVRQRPSGPARARNSGLDLATGRYIYFLDGDDWVLPGGLRCLLDAAEASPCGAAYGGYRCYDNEGRPLATGQLESLPDVGLDEHLERIRFSIHSQIILRERLAGVRFPEGNAVEDYEFWLRVAERGVRWASCGALVAAYRCARGSRSRRDRAVVESYARVLDEAFPRLRASGWSQRGTDLSNARRARIVRGLATYYAHRAVLDDPTPRKDGAWSVLLAASAPEPPTPRAWAELAFSVLPFSDLRRARAWRAERRRYAAAIAPFWRRAVDEGLAPAGFEREAMAALASVIAGQLVYRPVALAAALVSRLDLARPVHLLGLGKNGRALARLLLRRGNRVSGRDDGMAARELPVSPGGIVRVLDPGAPFDGSAAHVMTVLHDETYMAKLPRELPVLRASDLWREATRAELAELERVWPRDTGTVIGRATAPTIHPTVAA